jgi:diaphanous 1
MVKAQPAPLPPGRKELKDIKLRKLPWKKLPLAKINNTIWNMFKDNKYATSQIFFFVDLIFFIRSVEIDVPLIIEYFQERKEEKKEEKKLRKERKQVLDLKRANHIGLMLAMVKGRTYKQVRQAVIDLDESVLSEDLLRAFVKLTPQKTDIELLAPYKSYTEEQKLELGDADQFFLEIMDIPRLESRLQAFLFKKTFEVQYAELKEMVTAAAEAIKCVSTNFKLAKLLEIILNIGNFLNYDTYAGNAFGFSLDGLAKLRDTKSTVSPDYTLLHYLAQYITENRDKLLGFVDDLENISKGNNDFVNAINSAQSDLKAGMATLLGELEVSIF